MYLRNKKKSFFQKTLYLDLFFKFFHSWTPSIFYVWQLNIICLNGRVDRSHLIYGSFNSFYELLEKFMNKRSFGKKNVVFTPITTKCFYMY